MATHALRAAPRSRRGTSALALAAIMAVGLVSLGVAGMSLARSVQDSVALAPLGASGGGRASRTQRSDSTAPAPEPEPTKVDELPAELRAAPRDLTSILTAGEEPLSGWTLFAEQALYVGGQARVQGARTGSNGDVWVHGGGVVEGAVHPGPSGRVHAERTGAVQAVEAGLAAGIELPRVELASSEPDGDLVLAEDETRALPAGARHLGVLQLGPGATLELAGPMILVVEHLELAPGARVVVDGGAGAIELHVIGDLLLASRAELGSASGSPRELLLYLAADTLRRPDSVIDLTTDGDGRAGRIEGQVYAPDALVVLDRDFVLRGGLVAGAVRLDDRARVVAAGR